jgi:hypothetical protein
MWHPHSVALQGRPLVFLRCVLGTDGERDTNFGACSGLSDKSFPLWRGECIGYAEKAISMHHPQMNVVTQRPHQLLCSILEYPLAQLMRHT